MTRLTFLSILFLIPTAFAEEISLGVTAPMSGDFASAGEWIQKGVTLAAEDLPGVRVSFEDACLPANMITAVNSLIQREKIKALVSNYCVIGLNAAKENLERAGILTLQNSVLPDEIFSGTSHLVSTWPSIRDEVQQMSNELHGKRVAIFYLITQWGEGYANALKELVVREQGEVVFLEGIQIGANDFRSELQKIKAKNPEVMFFAHTGAMLSTMLKQARSMNLRQTVYAPSDADDPSVREGAGEAVKGLVVFTTHEEADSESTTTFQKRFIERYGMAPTPLARHAFDQTRLATEALRNCKGDTLCAAKQIRELRNVHGASGTFSLSPKGGAIRSFVRKEF